MFGLNDETWSEPFIEEQREIREMPPIGQTAEFIRWSFSLMEASGLVEKDIGLSMYLYNQHDPIAYDEGHLEPDVYGGSFRSLRDGIKYFEFEIRSEKVGWRHSGGDAAVGMYRDDETILYARRGEPLARWGRDGFLIKADTRALLDHDLLDFTASQEDAIHAVGDTGDSVAEFSGGRVI